MNNFFFKDLTSVLLIRNLLLVLLELVSMVLKELFWPDALPVLFVFCGLDLNACLWANRSINTPGSSLETLGSILGLHRGAHLRRSIGKFEAYTDEACKSQSCSINRCQQLINTSCS